MLVSDIVELFSSHTKFPKYLLWMQQHIQQTKSLQCYSSWWKMHRWGNYTQQQQKPVLQKLTMIFMLVANKKLQELQNHIVQI